MNENELTENQKLYLLSMAAISVIMVVHAIHVHIEEAMKRKYLAKHGEILEKVTNSEMYKRASFAEKSKILKEFESAGRLFKIHKVL